jgi:hypothetical protein
MLEIEKGISWMIKHHQGTAEQELIESRKKIVKVSVQ